MYLAIDTRASVRLRDCATAPLSDCFAIILSSKLTLQHSGKDKGGPSKGGCLNSILFS